MRFEEMCEEIFNLKHNYAYRKSYPDISTLVGLGKTEGGMVLFYFDQDKQMIPVPLTKEIFEADDWVCIDDVDERFNIKSFMTMPNAKDFMLDVYDFYNSGCTQNLPNQFLTMGYRRRFDEAVRLGLFHPDTKRKTIIITDIGYDLIKQLDR